VVDEDKPVIHTPTEGEVEKYGHIEVKTSMEVLTAKAEDRAINFSVWEERGSPIFKLPPGYKAPDREVDPDTDWAEYRVMEEDGIQPGDKIICPHLFGWSNAVVERDGYGVLYAENEGSGFIGCRPVLGTKRAWSGLRSTAADPEPRKRGTTPTRAPRVVPR